MAKELIAIRRTIRSGIWSEGIINPIIFGLDVVVVYMMKYLIPNRAMLVFMILVVVGVRSRSACHNA